MKKSLLFSAIAIGIYYLLRQIIGKEEESTPVPQPRKKHLTNAFAKAKEHAVQAAAE